MSDYAELSKERRRDREGLASVELLRVQEELSNALAESARLKNEVQALGLVIRNQVDQDLETLRERQMVRIEDVLTQAETWASACKFYFPALAERVKAGAMELPSPGSQRFAVSVPNLTCSRLSTEEMRGYAKRFYAIVSAASEAAATAGYFTDVSFSFELPPIAQQVADMSKNCITLTPG
jgi:hypothetical protein